MCPSALPYADPVTACPRRPLSKQTKQLLLISGTLTAITLVLFVAWVVHAVRCRIALTECQYDLYQLAGSLRLNAGTNEGSLPPSLDTPTQSPMSRSISTRPGFMYLGTGLQFRRRWASDDSSWYASRGIVLAHLDPGLGDRVAVLHADWSVSSVAKTDLPTALARSAAARAKWEAATRPATRP